MKKFLCLFAIVFVLVCSMTVFVSADSDDDESSSGILVLALAGPVYYGVMSAKYSDKEKRHKHESETPSEIDNLFCEDTFVESHKRSKISSLGKAEYSNESKPGKGLINQLTNSFLK